MGNSKIDYKLFLIGLLVIIAICFFVIRGCMYEKNNHDDDNIIADIPNDRSTTDSNLQQLGTEIDSSVERTAEIENYLERIEQLESRVDQLNREIEIRERREIQLIESISGILGDTQGGYSSAAENIEATESIIIECLDIIRELNRKSGD